MADRRIEIEVQVNASGAEAGLNQLSRSANRLEQQVTESTRRTGRTLDSLGDASANASRSAEAGQRSLIASIQRQSAAMLAGSRSTADYYEQLNRLRTGPSASLADHIRQLREIEEQHRRNSQAAGQSAAQTQQALQQVPAQITDIITQLQGGQNPLTVLIQQGGQLRDMFGGSSAAARALGDQLLKLINPYTAIAGVAATLGLAYYQGSKEADRYNRALIESGNAAGTSRNQLADYAREISKSVGTQAAASEALAALATTGMVSAQNLRAFGQVAIEVQRDIGRSIEDTAKDFAALGKSPLEASRELDQAYRFLTASTIEQIKALEERGRVEEAGELAQKAYAQAFGDRASKMRDNLGLIEGAWRSASDSAAKAWDMFLGVGRKTTPQQRLDEVNAALQLSSEAPSRGGNQRSDAAEMRRAMAAGNRPALLKEKVELELTIQKEQWDSAQQAISSQLSQSLKEWDQAGEKYMSRSKQIELEVARIRTAGEAAGVATVDIEKRVAKARAELVDESVAANIAALHRREAVGAELAKREMERIQLQRSLGLITEDAALQAAAKVDLDQLSQAKKLLQDELALVRRKADSLSEQMAISGKLGVLEEQRISRTIKLEGELSLLESRRVREANENYADLIESALKATDSIADQVAAQKEENSVIGLNKTALAELDAVRLESLAARKEENADIAEGLDLSGRLAEEYRAQAAALRELANEKRAGAAKQAMVDTAKKAEEEWKRASEQIGQSLADNIMRGGKSAAEYIRDLFRTMILRPVIQAVTQPVTNQLAGFMQGGGAAGSSGALGNAMNLFSAGKSIYSGFSSGLASSMGSIVQQYGSMFGSSAVSAFGAGMAGPGTSGFTTMSAAEIYSGMGMKASASAASAGSSAASALPIVGWIAAGMALSNSLYKQGWDAQNGSLTDSYGGKAIMPFNAPMLHLNTALQKIGLSNSLANMLSGASTVSKLFGRKNPEIESQGLQGTVSTGGFDGQTFAKILEKGGIFRSDKRYTQTAALGADQDKNLDDSIKAIIEAARGFASTLGIEASVIEGYNKQIKLELGKDEAKNQEAIAKLFGEIGDELSLRLVPNLSSFAKAGEATSAALQRLVTDYATVDEALTSIGRQFGAVGVSSLSARERLIEASGGLEAFAANTAGFQQNFLTESERLAPVMKSVTEQLASMGLSSVDTRKEFQQVVLGLDLTTEAGAKQYGQLMKMQGAFAMLYPEMEDVAAVAKAAANALAATNKGYQDQIDELLRARMSPEERRASDIVGMDASTIALYDRVAALQAEAAAIERAKAVAAERLGLQDQLDELTLSAADKLKKQRDALDESNRAIFDQIQAVKAQQTAAQEAAAAIKAAAASSAAAVQSFGNAVLAAMDRATASAKSMREFADSLKLGGLSTLDPDARYREAKKQFEAAGASNTAAAQAFLQASKDRGADSFYYERDFALVQDKLAKGAKALEDYAASLPDFFRGYQQMLQPSAPAPTPPAPSPAVQYGTMSKESANKADTEALRSEVRTMSDKLEAGLEKIAQSTGKTADYIDRVTEGGNGMVLAS